MEFRRPPSDTLTQYHSLTRCMTSKQGKETITITCLKTKQKIHELVNYKYIPYKYIKQVTTIISVTVLNEVWHGASFSSNSDVTIKF